MATVGVKGLKTNNAFLIPIIVIHTLMHTENIAAVDWSVY